MGHGQGETTPQLRGRRLRDRRRAAAVGRRPRRRRLRRGVRPGAHAAPTRSATRSRSTAARATSTATRCTRRDADERLSGAAGPVHRPAGPVRRASSTQFGLTRPGHADEYFATSRRRRRRRAGRAALRVRRLSCRSSPGAGAVHLTFAHHRADRRRRSPADRRGIRDADRHARGLRLHAQRHRPRRPRGARCTSSTRAMTARATPADASRPARLRDDARLPPLLVVAGAVARRHR